MDGPITERGHGDQAIDHPEIPESYCISGTRVDYCDPYLVLLATKVLEEMGLFGYGEAGFSVRSFENLGFCNCATRLFITKFQRT